jgi:hypothetical protein
MAELTRQPGRQWNRLEEELGNWPRQPNESIELGDQFGNYNSKKTEHGTVVPCSVDSFPDRLSSRDRTLLEWRISNHRSGAGNLITNHTRLVREESALTGAANRDRVGVQCVADRRRSAVAMPSERVAALRAGCQNCVNQASLRWSSSARICAAHRSQRRWIAVCGVGRRKRHRGSVECTD